MRLLPYVSSLCALAGARLRGRRLALATRELPRPDEAAFLSLKSRQLFFDLDDTLVPEGADLNAAICAMLDRLDAAGKKVLILTNCGSRRAARHRAVLQAQNCRAEFLPPSRKPDHRWLGRLLLERGWNPADCALIGDRATMDLWLARRAGFGEAVRLRWPATATSPTLVARLRAWEWRLAGG